MTISPAPQTSQLYPDMSGYTILETLYWGSRTAVYRALHVDRPHPVVIKVLQSKYPSFGEILQFRNQYTIAKNLPISGIVQTLSLDVLGNGYALVMEDWGGISLKKYMQERSLSWQETLAIALQIADTLHELSQYRVVHKDIKPANILIHPDSKQVKLIDFSIASLLPKEIQEHQTPNQLEGTLAYLAPEQTGRMNRGIDYRSDFYALGVTLYQMLTGTLPFISNDLLELVHCHIAKIPESADRVNPEVPIMVAKIVAKLMSKNAEDRYQSALGLKHDLAHCLKQWESGGVIRDFELGQRDLSDRFLIPEKLYGRETEVKQLLEAFDRIVEGSAELMLVAGFSGIGKTAVVNEVHKPIVKQRGYFIKGKFDQFNRHVPFSAFVQAFQDLISQLLSESDEPLARWKAQILEAVGDNGQVLIEVIPELEQIIGSQPPSAQLSATAAQNRFNRLLKNFIEVFTASDRPLVMFLDDLQWADAASLQLIKLLMNDKGHLLMLGAYRDNEVSAGHPFMLTVEELKKAQIVVNTITLAPLKFEDTNGLVADTLTCSRELAQPLTELIDRKTKGNPFFVTQFLKALYGEKYITFNHKCRYWECDIAQIASLTFTDDVVEFMALQLQKLPSETQEILKLASCIGNQFDLATLAIVLERSSLKVATDLWKSLQEGLILPISETYKFFQKSDLEDGDRHDELTVDYKFLHDRVQQAAYALIPSACKPLMHLKIGRLLQQNLSTSEQENHLFDITNHLNVGIDLITDLTERESLAKLNITSGQKAHLVNAYEAALNYFKTGLDLLPPDCWQTHYSLTLLAQEGLSETLLLKGDFEAMEQVAQNILAHTRTLGDRTTTVLHQLQSRQAQFQMVECVQLALEMLQALEIHFPESPTPDDYQQVLGEIAAKIGNRPIQALFDLPIMRDEQALLAIQILGSETLTHATYRSRPELFPLLVFRALLLTLEHGNSLAAPLVYVNYGLILIGVVGDVELGYQFGELALQLLETFNNKTLRPAVLFFSHVWLKHWKEPARQTLHGFKDAYATGLEVGELEMAALSILLCTYTEYYTGYELAELAVDVTTRHCAIEQIKQEIQRLMHSIYQQAIANLLGQTETPVQLTGQYCEEATILSLGLRENDGNLLCHLYTNKLMLAYLFGDYKLAQQSSLIDEQYLSNLMGTMTVPIAMFYTALTYLALYPKQSEDERIQTIERVTQIQEKLYYWGVHAPINYLHRWQLVEAEFSQVLGKRVEAIDFYDRAIVGAKDNGYWPEAGLANERAALFYLDWGKDKVAAGYMQEAYYCYANWGAIAKIKDLEQRYPQLLSPILQQVALNLTSIDPQVISTQTTSSSSPTTSDTVSMSQILDFGSAIKAAQAISSTIQLDELIANLTQIMMENSGAETCALILPDGETWQIRSMVSLNPKVGALSGTHPLETSTQVPVKLINYVKRTQASIQIDDSKIKLPGLMEEYLLEYQPQSLLCTPILHQGNLIGILYLEHRQMKKLFSAERLPMLQVLIAQVAISLDHALLYNTLEQKVEQRTEALSSALNQLQKTQSQLIQAEKMSSLGQLVAGIAHEVNNPVNFIHGNLKYIEIYMKNLLDLVVLFQETYPSLTPEIVQKIEDIDLEFLYQDTREILNSMQVGTQRIQDIVRSLRNFARLDESEVKSVDIHGGIESALTILESRLCLNSGLGEIQVVKEYSQLPPVKCYAGQMNQVFMNILINAIDALNEVRGMTGNGSPQIRIRTERIPENSIRITIANNGPSIPADIQSRLFDPFFTTKPVGKGTGMGLAISYQIVTEKHRGKLICHSEPGEETQFVIEFPIL